MSSVSCSFPRSHRITKKAQYDWLFRSPTKVTKNQYVSIFARRNPEGPQLGVIVAKKRFKRAVARNRLRRLVRESFRQQQAALQEFSIVVVVKRDFDHPAKRRLVQNLLLTLGKN